MMQQTEYKTKQIEQFSQDSEQFERVKAQRGSKRCEFDDDLCCRFDTELYRSDLAAYAHLNIV